MSVYKCKTVRIQHIQTGWWDKATRREAYLDIREKENPTGARTYTVLEENTARQLRNIQFIGKTNSKKTAFHTELRAEHLKNKTGFRPVSWQHIRFRFTSRLALIC